MSFDGSHRADRHGVAGLPPVTQPPRVRIPGCILMPAILGGLIPVIGILSLFIH
ncbi:hypothetical protein MRBLMI12_000468 [Microbacterium sp. LMI12-1-1.1]|uniref:hypothetical protein n=1 Tax=Microbacterium sp. LMI12-1-1.1 TaxID=3135225 RepID=UPI003421C6B8